MNPEDLMKMLNSSLNTSTMESWNHNFREMFIAINTYCKQLGVAAISPSVYEDLYEMVRDGQIISAIKKLREMSRLDIVPVINKAYAHSLEDDVNDFYKFVKYSQRFHPLADTYNQLGLKQAKDIIDVIKASKF